MTTSFIAVDTGYRADGYLVVNGIVFVARSGGLGAGPDWKPTKKGDDASRPRGEIPQGTYKLGPPERLNQGRRQNITMADGSANWDRFRKFDIAGVGTTLARGGGIVDERYPTEPRTGLKFHYDGDEKGSSGCIVYDDPKAQDALTAAQARGDNVVEVIYVESDAIARQMADERAAKAKK